MFQTFMIKRDIEDRIKKHTDIPVISVTGPRQSGKTTLCKKLFSDYKYTNLENPETRRYALTDPRGFMNLYPKMIIDEIQRIPELFSYIQVIVDEDKTRKFVITGSQNFLISKQVSQSLAGRVAIFKLLPLSIHELNQENLLSDSRTVQIWQGMYPRIYNQKIDIKKWYEDYTETYLQKDVRTISNITDLSIFHQFLVLLAGRTGQILNLSSLSNDLGISVNTLKNWVSILEASYIVTKLQPFTPNINKRVIRSPKIYFLDTGLACSLLNINTAEQLETHPLVGALFETLIVGEFIKHNYNSEFDKNLFFLQDKLGREIDLVTEEANILELIEIKYSQTFNSDFAKNIKYFSERLERDTTNKIIYGGDDFQRRSEFTLLPWDGEFWV